MKKVDALIKLLSYYEPGGYDPSLNILRWWRDKNDDEDEKITILGMSGKQMGMLRSVAHALGAYPFRHGLCVVVHGYKVPMYSSEPLITVDNNNKVNLIMKLMDSPKFRKLSKYIEAGQYDLALARVALGNE